MKYYITTDTHFGHGMLVREGYRHEGFEVDILKNLSDVSGDVFLHLGDVCMGRDKHWHGEFMKVVKPNFKKCILVRGNHDTKSYSWYYDNGWDFVCDLMRLRVNGKELVFSHRPIITEEHETVSYHDVDINIHGHLHGKGNASHRTVEGYRDGFHYDCAPDVHYYKPVSLDTITT